MIKIDFPLFHRHKKLVYLDSAATSQKPKTVIEAEKEWYETLNANVHRGAYDLAEKATAAFEEGRSRVAKFINAESPENIVFTKGATEGINLVAQAWAKHNLKPGDTILLTEMEHHANIVPWQLLAKEKKLNIKYWPITSDGVLSPLDKGGAGDLFCPPEKGDRGVSLLALTHISNVLGTINPLEKIIPEAHKHGIKVLVDAAQSVPHMPVDVQKLDPDFLVFSSHKMLGPTGLGVLVAKKERLAEMQPYQGGGEMIERVTWKGSTFRDAPWKFEAGTQPLAQVFGLTAAIDTLEKIGMKKVWQHNVGLTEYAYKQLNSIPEVTILGPAGERGALISFTVKDLHPHDLSTFLDRHHICIRAGHHCAMPLHQKLNIPASARISFHVYNDKNDIDCFIKALKTIIKQWQDSTNN